MRLILVGGGLANSLIAYRLAAMRPEVDWTILEAGPELGGNHTWSFHDTDLTPEQNLWLEPFIAARWPAYEVRFPGLERRMPIGYRSTSAETLRREMAPHAARVRTGVTVDRVTPTAVTLADGETLQASAVVDGRGFRQSPHLATAYQKFVGIEVRTGAPHGLDLPVVMDATVAQRDGFRFVYLLPFGPDRLLIEDTYYSDNHDLDVAATRDLACLYARQKGWAVAEILREEHGVLPIGLGGDIDALWADAAGVARSGMRAALFHPTTGYSLPDAVRLADKIAAQRDLGPSALFRLTRAHSIRCWRAAGFYRLLDRLLFRAAEPDTRYRLLERFYGLPTGLIARFYAGRSTLFDKVRILSGNPPVPIGRALRCLPESSIALARP